MIHIRVEMQHFMKIDAVLYLFSLYKYLFLPIDHCIRMIFHGHVHLVIMLMMMITMMVMVIIVMMMMMMMMIMMMVMIMMIYLYMHTKLPLI